MTDQGDRKPHPELPPWLVAVVFLLALSIAFFVGYGIKWRAGIVFAVSLPYLLTLGAVVHPRSRRLGLFVAAAFGWVLLAVSLVVVLPAAYWAFGMTSAFHDPTPDQKLQLLLLVAFPLVQFLLAVAAGTARSSPTTSKPDPNPDDHWMYRG